MNQSSSRISNHHQKKKKYNNDNDDEVDEYDKELDKNLKNFMIKQAFNMFDEDHSGEIDKNEFRALIKSIGLKMTEKEIDDMIADMDKDENGAVDFEEFSNAMEQHQFGKSMNVKQHLESAFNEYDKDMDDYISAKDMFRLSSELDKDPLSSEECALFVRLCKHFGNQNKINNDDDKLVSKDEFINFLYCIGFLKDKDKDKDKEEPDANFDKSGSDKMGLSGMAKSYSSYGKVESKNVDASIFS